MVKLPAESSPDKIVLLPRDVAVVSAGGRNECGACWVGVQFDLQVKIRRRIWGSSLGLKAEPEVSEITTNLDIHEWKWANIVTYLYTVHLIICMYVYSIRSSGQAVERSPFVHRLSSWTGGSDIY